MAAFDSREYEWADITAIAGGRDITGLRGIKYNEKIEREAIHAKGRHAHTIQSGNVMVDGSIKMLQSEFEAMVVSGGGTILSLSIDILVNYGNPSEGNIPLFDRLQGVRFLESPKEMNQGDKFQEIELPFVALNVKRNIT